MGTSMGNKIKLGTINANKINNTWRIISFGGPSIRHNGFLVALGPNMSTHFWFKNLGFVDSPKNMGSEKKKGWGRCEVRTKHFNSYPGRLRSSYLNATLELSLIILKIIFSKTQFRIHEFSRIIIPFEYYIKAVKVDMNVRKLKFGR